MVSFSFLAKLFAENFENNILPPSAYPVSKYQDGIGQANHFMLDSHKVNVASIGCDILLIYYPGIN